MQDAQSVTQRVNEFETRHGGRDKIVVDGGWLLFPNGAKRETNPLGLLADPPTDKFELAKAKHRYCQVKLSLAVQEFTLLKEKLHGQVVVAQRERFAPPPPPQAEIVALDKLRIKVDDLATRLGEAETHLEASRPAGMVEAEKRSNANREACSQYLEALNKIEV